MTQDRRATREQLQETRRSETRSAIDRWTEGSPSARPDSTRPASSRAARSIFGPMVARTRAQCLAASQGRGCHCRVTCGAQPLRSARGNHHEPTANPDTDAEGTSVASSARCRERSRQARAARQNRRASERGRARELRPRDGPRIRRAGAPAPRGVDRSGGLTASEPPDAVGSRRRGRKPCRKQAERLCTRTLDNLLENVIPDVWRVASTRVGADCSNRWQPDETQELLRACSRGRRRVPAFRPTGHRARHAIRRGEECLVGHRVQYGDASAQVCGTSLQAFEHRVLRLGNRQTVAHPLWLRLGRRACGRRVAFALQATAGSAVVTVARVFPVFFAFVTDVSSTRHTVYTVYTDLGTLTFLTSPPPPRDQ